MDNELLQQLITAIEALIQVQNQANSTRETGMDMQAEHFQEQKVQNEAMITLLADLKNASTQPNLTIDDIRGVLAEHASGMPQASTDSLTQAINDLVVGVAESKGGEQAERVSLAEGIASLNSTMLTIVDELKKKDESAYEIEITPELFEKLKGKDGKPLSDEEKNKLVSRATDMALERLQRRLEGLSGATANDVINAIRSLAPGQKLRIEDLEGKIPPDLSEAVARLAGQVAGMRNGTMGTGPLGSLSDVDLAGLANGNTIVWDSALRKWKPGTAGGGAGTPATAVVSETAFGQSSAVGVSTDYARADHTHGTPTDPIPAHVAAGDPHTQYQKESEKDVANGYAGLDAGGKINSAQLPAIAISDTFVVGSQAAQTALTAEVGDVAVRTDQNKSYILRVSPASVFANWQELLTPTDAVLSFNGRVGAVTPQAGDYTATQVTNTPAGNIAAVTVQAAINELDTEKSDIAHTHSGLAPTGGSIGQVLKKNSNTNYDYSWQADNTGGGGVALTEVEIDFGTITVPITSWTITDAGIGPSNKILVFPSPNPATGRKGNDWEADSALFTGLAGTGNFALTVIPTTRMVGMRKIYYQVI